MSHILRVWKNVQALMDEEGGDSAILTAATIMHDCVAVPKDSPDRQVASRLSAQKASKVLDGLRWRSDQIDLVSHAIEAHSFSANIAPRTLEARILQDADRLDALGHIGIARCLYVSGRLNRAIYDMGDPDASDRALDDGAYAMDHFQSKLLRLAQSFQTATGQRLARKRHQTVQSFFDGLMAEVR